MRRGATHDATHPRLTRERCVVREAGSVLHEWVAQGAHHAHCAPETAHRSPPALALPDSSRRSLAGPIEYPGGKARGLVNAQAPELNPNSGDGSIKPSLIIGRSNQADEFIADQDHGAPPLVRAAWQIGGRCPGLSKKPQRLPVKRSG